MFRHLAIFPGAFTLDGAETVAGAEAGQAVLHLVDCSLIAPPSTGADGRARYTMLETLRAYGTERLTAAGQQPEAAAALAGHALQVAGQAAAGLETSAGELGAAQWLDAEDATMHQALAWCMKHDLATALRLAVALAPWWRLRGRYVAGYELLRAATEHTEKDGEAWCAAQVWLGSLAPGPADDVVGLKHFTAVRNALAARAPSPMLVRALAGQAGCLANLGRLAEAAEEGRQALTMARELGDPAGEARALFWLAATASYAGDPQTSASLLRQAQRIDPGCIPGRLARSCCNFLSVALVEAGEFASAQRSCAHGLALARQAGDLLSLTEGLKPLVDLDLLAGRVSEARMHLREAIEAASRLGPGLVLLDCIDYCGYLCVAIQRCAEAITLWAAHATWLQDAGIPDLPQDARLRQEFMRKAQQDTGHRQDTHSGGTRQGHDPGHCRRVRRPAGRRRIAGTGYRPGTVPAQHAGTGTSHPRCPGAHRCPDRRAALHQRPHRPLPPGPHPRQDRQPTPRGPDPAGIAHGPGLTGPVTAATAGLRGARDSEGLPAGRWSGRVPQRGLVRQARPVAPTAGMVRLWGTLGRARPGACTVSFLR